MGHRGSSENYPENTMLSFEKALEEGAGGIELDVRKTSDGEFIVIHDSTVDRTTDGEGVVSELSWDYISQLDAGSWKSSKFANRDDTKVPKLIDVLDTYKDEPVFFKHQLKGRNGRCFRNNKFN